MQEAIRDVRGPASEPSVSLRHNAEEDAEGPEPNHPEVEKQSFPFGFRMIFKIQSLSDARGDKKRPTSFLGTERFASA